MGTGRRRFLAAILLALFLPACAVRFEVEAGRSSTPSPPGQAAPASEGASGLGGANGPRRDDAPVIRQGPVVDIVDGDTIDLGDGTRVRIAMVDAPEIHGQIEPCGPEANDFAGEFLAGQTVAIYRPVDAPQEDRYGRTLGEVVRVVDGSSLNEALVRAGLAEVDERFADEDPDLASRLRDAADGATVPACRQ